MKPLWDYVTLVRSIMVKITALSQLENALAVANFSLVIMENTKGILLTKIISKHIVTNCNLSLMLDRIIFAYSSTMFELLIVVFPFSGTLSFPYTYPSFRIKLIQV